MTNSNAFLGTGRRKTAVARVRLFEGAGESTVNGLSLENYFPGEMLVNGAVAPLVTAELRDGMHFTARVEGSGPSAQSIAVAQGLARALQKVNADLRPALKKAGHLTRDPRERERKKPGRPGARKRFQFSKR